MLASPSLPMMILAFLLVLGPLVVLHELGHYLVARWFGVRADAFSVGFGKEIIGFTDKRGTRWKLSALPLGGYVQFAGDMNPASVPAPDAPREPGMFQHAPLWQRALIVLAGPLANLIVAVLIFAGFAMIYGTPVAEPVVRQVIAGSPAEAAGLRAGDRIVAIDGAPISNFLDIAETIAPIPGQTVTVALDRAGRQISVPVKVASRVDKDRFGNEMRRGVLGIPFPPITFQRVGPAKALTLGVEQSWGTMKLMALGLKQIVVGERSFKELGGPIKIAKYSGEQLSLGWAAFAGFAALISINLAFINLLPIPTLDGGHLVMYAAEAVRRRPLGPRSQEWAFRTGMALVLMVMVFATLNDLAGLPLFGR